MAHQPGTGHLQAKQTRHRLMESYSFDREQCNTNDHSVDLDQLPYIPWGLILLPSRNWSFRRLCASLGPDCKMRKCLLASYCSAFFLPVRSASASITSCALRPSQYLRLKDANPYKNCRLINERNAINRSSSTRGDDHETDRKTERSYQNLLGKFKEA
jgi:hypothetical protein